MAKKRSKNLVVPILLGSTILSLGIVGYQARSKFVPIGINEVAAPASNCAQVAFTDNFDGTSLNPTKWFAYEYYSNGTATVDNNALKLTIPSGKSNWPKMFVNTENKVVLEGDFVQEITVKSLSSLPADHLSSFVLGLAAAQPESAKHWYRAEIFSNGDIQTFGTTDGVSSQGKAVNAFKNTPTRLKMVRKGSTLTTYYDAGTGYVLHSTLNNIYSGKLYTQLITLSHPTSNPAVTAIVDDYKLNCLPPAPTNLSHSCSPDGTKATLKWDNNSPSGKYHFALDDIKESDEDWYKPGTTDVWRGGDYASNSYELPIIPGREYKWWVNTNLDYTTRSETVVKTFTCDPKPSVPSNPKFTCSPDGTSVKFSWDSVSEVESYKVRIDDKNGKVTNYDDIKDLQKVVAVTPGKTYSWWMHSHKGSYDSNQSSAVDFSCSNTVSPTPKPTVKPTVTPVVSKGDEVYVPDDTPTPTPRASIKASPRASLSTTPVPSALVNDTPVAPVSTNPISRFFRWLAGLFE